MELYRTRDPDVLMMSNASALRLIVSLAFLGLGAALMLTPHGHTPIPPKSLPNYSFYLGGGFMAFLALESLVFGNGATFDRRNRKLTKWYLAPNPLLKRTVPLERFEQIRIDMIVRYRPRSRLEIHQYYIRFVGDGVRVTIARLYNQLEVHTRAREIAAFLDMDCYDANLGEMIHAAAPVRL